MQGGCSMSNSVRTVFVLLVAVLFVLVAPKLIAKNVAVTLEELVQQSPVIVFGRVDTKGTSAPKPGAGWVSFKSSRVLRGDASLNGRDIQLCNSPPSMREYPDLSRTVGRWSTGDFVLFLSAEKGGCFEYSFTTTSVVPVRNGSVATAGIADQPIYLPWNVFLARLRKLTSK